MWVYYYDAYPRPLVYRRVAQRADNSWLALRAVRARYPDAYKIRASRWSRY